MGGETVMPWPRCADDWGTIPTEKRPGEFVVSVEGGGLGDEGNKGNTRENTAFLEEMTEEVGGWPEPPT